MTATAMLDTSTPPPVPPPVPDPGDAHDPAAGTLAVANAALRGGFVLLPRTLLHASGLSRDAKLLYAVLLSYAWQRGSCFPGYERLQADLQCGVNQVTKYLRELEGAGLVTRRKRGQGKTTLYTLHDPPAPPTAGPTSLSTAVGADASQTHQISESGVTGSVGLGSPIRRHKQDSAERDPEEHHPTTTTTGAAPQVPPAPLAPTDPPAQEPPGAGDDDVFELLVAQGVTPRIAKGLVAHRPGEAIRQQVAWQPFRPKATSPAGALVQAIRDAWPPPPAWLEAQEHAAAVARQEEEERRRREEDEARRREWEAKPAEERIAGRLAFWLQGRRAKRHEPSPEEIEAKRAELLAALSPPAPAG